MTNPFHTPAQTEVEKQSESWPDLKTACATGIRFALRWVTLLVAPLLVLVFVIGIGAIAYRAVVLDVWPDFGSPQIYYSIGVLILLLLAAYLVACFWVCLAAAIIYGVRHLGNRGKNEGVLD